MAIFLLRFFTMDFSFLVLKLEKRFNALSVATLWKNTNNGTGVKNLIFHIRDQSKLFSFSSLVSSFCVGMWRYVWVLEWSASLRIVALKHNYFIENTPHWTDKGAKDIVSCMLLCNALRNLPNFNPCSCHLVVVFLLLPAILKYRYRTLSEATKTALKNINKFHSQGEK